MVAAKEVFTIGASGDIVVDWERIFKDLSFSNIITEDLRADIESRKSLVDIGILSVEKEENYEILCRHEKDNVLRDFSLNPKIGNETYYFVREEDAEAFMALRIFCFPHQTKIVKR
jgi:hypothetical protein